MLCDGFVSTAELYVVVVSVTLLCLLAVLFLATARGCCGAVGGALNATLRATAAFSAGTFCVTSSSTLDVYST